MRKCRRQHEQLRNVIIRVLRPQRKSSQPPTPDPDQTKNVCEVFVIIKYFKN